MLRFHSNCNDSSKVITLTLKVDAPGTILNSLSKWQFPLSSAPNWSLEKYYCTEMQPRFYKRLYRQRKINAVLFLFKRLRPYLGKACKLILHIPFGGHARTVHLRLRPHVSGYFWIRNFFFPDTLSVHTYSVNPEYESATFWICPPEWKFLITLWILNRVDAKLNSDTFLIRWSKKIEPSSLPWILLKMATSLPGSLYTRRCKL